MMSTYRKLRPIKTNLTKKTRVPLRYIPKNLTRKDRHKQSNYLKRSRRMYKRGVYYTRPKVSSFRNVPSPHVKRAMKMYNVPSLAPNQKLAKASGCSVTGLRKIIKKGQGAYYSSGSRPNQTAQSWAYARLGSSLTGQNAAIIDYSILKAHCKPNSRALKLATRRIRRK